MAYNALTGVKVRVLMYHGISSKDVCGGIENYYGYNVSLQEFTKHLLDLRHHCNVISLNDALCGRKLSTTRTNVVITFDDGYENNYHNAFTLLQQYSLPAVFSLPTAFVFDRKPLWNDLIEYAINKSPRKHVRIFWGGHRRDFVIGDIAGKLALFNWVFQECTRMAQALRDSLIANCLDELGLRVSADEMFVNEDYRPLNIEQLELMAGSGIAEFASHSVRHYVLPRCDAIGRRAELVESKERIESVTKLPCGVFCVPAGAYDRELLDDAFSCGYEYVLTSDMGDADITKRVINRNCIRSRRGLHEFADIAYGPLLDVVAMARRILRRPAY